MFDWPVYRIRLSADDGRMPMVIRDAVTQAGKREPIRAEAGRSWFRIVTN